MNFGRPKSLISVIVAVYNGAATLQQCIDSVVSQTYQDVELIVIDGGSTDGTVDLLVTNASKLGYWVSEPDKGIYNAWNKALRHTNGEWVCFLGADDYLWSNDAMARMAEVLKTLPPETQIAYGQVMLLGLDDAPLYLVGEPYNIKAGQRVDVMGMPPHPGLMHRRAVFEERGGFDESFRIAGDTELLLRELQRAPARFVPGVIVAGMRQGGISSKPANVLKSLQELRRIQRKHGIRWSGVPLTLARLRASVRWILWSVMGERFTRLVLDFGRKVLGKPAYWTRT
ncbi:MAG: glycosyltransferase [Burkholderiales bacterium]|nr:glycosyltransferase [Burkholderiales bacterium]